MKRAHTAAREKLKVSTKPMNRNYDLKVMERAFEEGDVIHLLDSATLKGSCKKLSSLWKGPVIIVKKITPSIYRTLCW